MAGEAAQGDERPGYRREPEGDRFAAELRDGEVFRRRAARGRALRRRDGALPGGGAEDGLFAGVPERGAIGADHRRACRRDGDGGDRGAVGRADRGRFRHGQRLHAPDHHAAELPRHRLPRDPAGAGRHGRDVRPARPAGRDPGQAGRAGAEGFGRRGDAGGRALRLRAGARDPEGGHDPGAAGREGGDRRSLGVGQVDHRAASVPLLRRDRRGAEDRRAGRARGDAGEPARRDRRGAASRRCPRATTRSWANGG